jgi:hypothetical protein
MIIYGLTLIDIHVNPISLTANQNANFIKRVKLTWPTAGNTLLIAGGATSTELKTQTLNYGMWVTNSSNDVVESIDRGDKPLLSVSLVGLLPKIIKKYKQNGSWLTHYFRHLRCLIARIRTKVAVF